MSVSVNLSRSSPPFLHPPPPDQRSPSCPLTSQQRRTMATCRWMAEWPIAAARRGSRSTSNAAIPSTGPTTCAGTLTSSQHTLTRLAARGRCWQAIRWSIEPSTQVVKVDGISKDSADGCFVSFRSQYQMRHLVRRILKHPTAPSAGESKEWTATVRSGTARILTTTRNTILWR